MIIRNTHGLPRSLVDTVLSAKTPHERREGADISVTELIGPPRIKQLKDKYYDQVDIDASDRAHALMGTAIHGLISKAPYALSSVRLFARWKGLDRMWAVSGEFDLLEDGILWDFKPLKAQAVFDGPKEEWVQQLNIYRALCLVNRIPVAGLKACAYIRDFTPNQRFREKKYPLASLWPMDVPMWSIGKTMAYIGYRLTEHEKEMPLCTNEERWAKPHEYALMTDGRKTAVALYSNKEDAERNAAARETQLNKKFRVEERPQESTRCRYYCEFARFCDCGIAELSGVKQKS